MNTRHEQNILTFSAVGALFFAILALVWGWLTHSQMIMFDGIYSFISLVLTILYFYAARSIAMGRDGNFPFGRAQIEPLAVSLQSIFLIVICMKAFSGAVITLFSGAPDINSLSGMLYATIGVIGCFGFWYYIVNVGVKKSPNSELLKTQGGQWFMDTLLSLAVLIGFFTAYILQLVGYEQYARYMDPLMVIVAVLFFVREPLVALVGGIRGLLIMAPEKTVYSASKEVIKEVAKQRGFEDVVLRLGKAGRGLVYEVSFVAKDPNNSCSIGEMDAIHREVEERLRKLFDTPLWLSVSFVHDRKLG
ncbi:MAG: cation transporter [Candidatus Saganbacteria bacterium]|nr:cation transporter [Candidatus Saganbacteria bacterium]